MSIDAVEPAVPTPILPGGVGRSGTWADGCTFCGGNGGAVRFAESDTNKLTIRHVDVSSEPIQNIILGANSVGLIDKIDETTFLKYFNMLSELNAPDTHLLRQKA